MFAVKVKICLSTSAKLGIAVKLVGLRYKKWQKKSSLEI
jgi:hypothetical protein